MAFDVEVSSFTTATVTGNQSVTGLGFVPKAVIILGSQHNVDGSVLHAEWGMGMGISAAKQWAFGNTAEDEGAGGTAGRRWSESLILIVSSGNPPVVDQQAELVSMDADGFTINWSTNDGTARLINYIAVGGDEISVDAGLVQAPTSTGTQVVNTAVSPDAVFFAGANSLAEDTGGSWTYFSCGAAIDASNEWFSQSRVTYNGNSHRAQRTNRCLGLINSTTGYFNEAQFDSKTGSSFTLDWLTVDASVQGHYAWLAIAGVNVKVGSFNQSSSTGNQAVTGVGFKGGVALFAGIANVATASVITVQRGFFGAAQGSSNRFAVAHNADVTGGAADRNTLLDRTKCIKHVSGSSPGSVDAEADFISFDTDGFTVNNTTADATAREVLYFVFGSPAATPPGPDVVTAGTTLENAFTKGFVVVTSDIAAVNSAIILTAIDAKRTHCQIGVQFFANAAGTVVATPALGTMTVEIETLNTTPVREALGSTISASAPTTLSWIANTIKVKVTPSGVDVATHYRIVVTCNEN